MSASNERSVEGDLDLGREVLQKLLKIIYVCYEFTTEILKGVPLLYGELDECPASVISLLTL